VIHFPHESAQSFDRNEWVTDFYWCPLRYAYYRMQREFRYAMLGCAHSKTKRLVAASSFAIHRSERRDSESLMSHRRHF
jgi:hypothetical protein